MNSTFLFKLSRLLFIAGLTFLGLGRTASAALDGKVYPGTLCWSNALFTGLLYHHWQGLVVNYDGNWVETWCPIITDNESNTAGLNRLRVSVHESAPGWNAGGSFCDVLAYAPNGDLVSTGSGMPSNSGDRTFDIPLSSSPANATYTLVCYLSAYSWLYEYEVEER
jgi:hypothetical protein